MDGEFDFLLYYCPRCSGTSQTTRRSSRNQYDCEMCGETLTTLEMKLSARTLLNSAHAMLQRLNNKIHDEVENGAEVNKLQDREHEIFMQYLERIKNIKEEMEFIEFGTLARIKSHTHKKNSDK